MSSPGTSSRSPRCLVRRAAGADAPAIESLYRELVDDPDVRVLSAQVEEMGKSPASFLLVAEVDAVVCGTVLLTLCADAMYGVQPFAVIENLVVARSSRRLGIGRDLLFQAERITLERDGSKLMLLSSIHRDEAHAWFRNCGFAGDAKRAFVKYRSQFASPS